jgi:CRISPR/Cas system-associated endonuclease/helicase Cas3
MALTFNKAIHEQRSMLIEAPTGTGKTLAYLIPIALCLRSAPKQRFVIAVASKHLQAQIERDMESFAEEFPELKESAILKGANNYLCLNRLKRAAFRSQHGGNGDLQQLFDNFRQHVVGKRIDLHPADKLHLAGDDVAELVTLAEDVSDVLFAVIHARPSSSCSASVRPRWFRRQRASAMMMARPPPRNNATTPTRTGIIQGGRPIGTPIGMSAPPYWASWTA